MKLNLLSTKKMQQTVLLHAMKEFKQGNFDIRLSKTGDVTTDEIAEVFNETVDMVQKIIGEFTRIGNVVGKEGQIGSRIYLPHVPGGWQDKIKVVNTLIIDLAHPMIEMSRVIGAVASGDLTQNMPIKVNGRALEGAFYETAKIVNTMVDQLSSFASEVTRVAREVGTEGKLGGQADVKGLAGAGTWRELTENVNRMANNLTTQVRNIAEVTTAVANGDLTRKINVNVKGEILQLKITINTMVDQLSSFASEVTRVAREVGTEGKLGGQADVKGVGGIWKDLTDNVNHMANNLTSQVRNIADVTTAVAMGDLSKKITVDVCGEFLQLKDTINTMVDQLRAFASEVTRVAREVGTEGKLGGQAYVLGVGGTWKDLTDNVNHMASNLTSQVRNIATVTTAVARGDLSKKITVDAKGEILELKDTINIMVDQLSSFAAEVTRVAREVGTEGKLGGQAVVKGVGGIWKDFTENVNQMASNLTEQVRSIAKVVTAVAEGDLKKKLRVQAKGEVAALSETINSMIDTLATFADQVTSVAREVGVEGRLGGQASVPGAAGTWKDLTDNVNQLAANLTNQVRAISQVARAVTTGDLTRTICVAAQGEVAALKDIINEMIFNLKETTLKNAEQDWLKTNLAKITRILQGQKDLGVVARLILSELVPMVSSQHGVFYMYDTSGGDVCFRMLVGYAYKERKNISTSFKLGEGLVGQCAYEKERILISNVPDDYIYISSGLGERKPTSIVVLPILFEGTVKAVIELASLHPYTRTQLALLDQLTEIIGIVLNSIETNSRTESLLKQSQSMANELGVQKEELKKTNAELEEKAKQLVAQNVEVAEKNKEVEIARCALEEKAEQLALTSKYKSEFLANMSHELRTPLNSLLLLSQHLATNSEGNLNPKQIEYAKTISSSGTDLLNLINDILDLSKIESGVASLYIDNFNLRNIIEDLERMFKHIAESKSLYFKLHIDDDVPEVIQTDAKRLRQVLKNFLSNAYKFTRKGGVTLSIFVANSGWQVTHPVLSKANKVIAFRVSDTGMGIPSEKQQIIFEAFQQADGTTSRKYGGCGLGLSISREIAILLGGEIALQSEENHGSHFTFYVSQVYINPFSALRKSVPALPPQVLQPTNQIVNEVLNSEVKDDRFSLKIDDAVVLVVNNNDVLLPELLHAKDFKYLHVNDSNEALSNISQYNIKAVIIDLYEMELDGKRFIKKLKGEIKTRHIALYVLNAANQHKTSLLLEGVRLCFVEPLNPNIANFIVHDIASYNQKTLKKILLADKKQPNELLDLIQANDSQIEIIAPVNENLPNDFSDYDCVIAANMMVDELQQLFGRRKKITCPIIFYQEDQKIPVRSASLEDNSILFTPVNSPENLLDKTALFLHRCYYDLSPDKQAIIDDLHGSSDILMDKNILLVDDDVRNIFAMTSALEDYGIKIKTAECGKDALEILSTVEAIDCILMDVMMPDLDGYEATRMIRSQNKYKETPIIAITAKAMKDDCAKCLYAGASDYLPKPVDKEILINTLRLWLK